MSRSAMVRIAALFILCLTLAASASSAQPPRVTPPCDRACLEGFVDRYLDAMLADEVSPKLFARNVKFTENGVQLPLGNEGLWFGMSGKGTYRFYVPDVETQQVAFIGTVRENLQSRGANTGDGSVVAIGLRLKVVDGLITEVEQLAIRPETHWRARSGRRPRGAGAGAPAPAAGGARGTGGGAIQRRSRQPRRSDEGAASDLRETIPAAKRPSREELVETANHYFTGLARNDGKGYYPFTDDCERFENGVAMTQRNCKQQFEQTLRGIVSRIRDRRFVAVDRERGIVFAFAFFDHEQINWTWQLAELFKIENGLIRRVEAVFHRAPYGTPSGWSTFEQAMSESIQSVR